MIHSNGLSRDENGSPVLVVGFDYEAVDRGVFCVEPESDLSEFTEKELDAGICVLRCLLQWMWQDGMKNPQGLLLRGMVICWIFLKELRPLQLSQLARGYGKKKQSLGRWVDHFKRTFPKLKTPHMRPLQ